MGVNQRRQLHPLHLFEQQRNVVDALRDDVRYLIHAQSLAQSGIYLQIWANGKYNSPFAVQKVQKLNFQGGLSFGPTCTLSPGRSVAMLSAKQLQLGRGGCHESATGATGPGDPRAKRLG